MGADSYLWPNFFFIFAVVVCIFGAHGSAVEGKKARYDYYRVIRVIPSNEQELAWLRDAAYKRHDLDFWKEPSIVGHPVDIMIPPTANDFLKVLINEGFKPETMIRNVQKLIDSESTLFRQQVSLNDEDFYTHYRTFEEIDAWIDDIASTYSDLVSVESVSKSHEERIVRGLKIGKPSGTTKPAAYIQGGIHAREWVSPATVMFMTYKLLNAYGTDTTVTEMFDKFDWYIVPVLNADGYHYTWSNNRMWRKNRRQAPGNICVGTDLNRNYAYKWGGAGASRISCALTYRGTGPASEIETSEMTNFLTKKSESTDIHLYIDFHSYGLLWLYPWGYTDDRTVPQADREKQRALALEGNEAIIATHGKSYFVGEAGADLYPASGGSDDWAYGELKIKYTYTIELRDDGKYGFVLPESEIKPTTEEIYNAMLVVGQKLISEL